MILLLDNYDSFTFNLYQYLCELGEEVTVRRNDAMTPEEVAETDYAAIVISPGPCTPDTAGISLDIISRLAGCVPILGVCLGHQCIGQALGGRVIRAPRPVHGKASSVTHQGDPLFADIPSPFRAGRYHSLVIEPSSVPAGLRVIATSDDDAQIMAVAHESFPLWGVQFHPESILTEHGHTLLRNFLSQAARFRREEP